MLASVLVALACRDERPATTGVAAPVATPRAGAGDAHHFAFTDVALAAGLTRVTLAGRPTKDHLLDSAGTGCAWLDYDRDGQLDAYVVNGWRIEHGRVLEKGRNALYRNKGDGTFEDVTDAARVAGEGQWGCGVAVADYDGDGWPDLMVTSFGPNLLYHNLGNGTFENVAARLGIECPGWNTGAAFFDADRDGRLDLYVAAYIKCTLEDVLRAERTLDWKGLEKVALGPFGLPGAPDHFFHADGKGGFVDLTEAAGLTDRALAFGFSVRAADFDLDHDVDLYVANDSDANYLYRNEGNGTFQDTGLWSGAALDRNGVAQAGMGITMGDVDQDGLPDLFVTNFAEDFSTLYRGTGQGFFEDATVKSGTGAPTYAPLSWGTTLSDLDNDGDLDLVIVNGHIYPQVDRHPEAGMSYLQKPLLLENLGNGKFVDASAGAGPGFATARCSRGLAAGDYDNDGDIDLLITNLDAPPTLLRNDSEQGAWLTVACEVPPGTCPLIGTIVTVQARGRTQTRDVTSSDSYLSCPDPRLHFGLGAATVVDQVTVAWSDGTLTTLEQVLPGRIVKVVKPGR
ncbi:MAG: CRTAC1 family protein [Planctomycetota bacterium]